MLIACDSDVLWSDELYEVSWIDTKNNLILSRKIDDSTSLSARVDSYIVAVGSDNQYVVAKNRNVNTHEIYYFYIDKRKDNNYLNQSEITEGPFSDEQFSKLKAELDLPDFTKEF